MGYSLAGLLALYGLYEAPSSRQNRQPIWIPMVRRLDGIHGKPHATQSGCARVSFFGYGGRKKPQSKDGAGGRLHPAGSGIIKTSASGRGSYPCLEPWRAFYRGNGTARIGVNLVRKKRLNKGDKRPNGSSSAAGAFLMARGGAEWIMSIC